MELIEQTENFRRVLQFANETNRCVFLTGKAGTGKTTLLKFIRENSFKQIAVVAPTGVAAINAGGATIHSFFQLPFTPFLPPENNMFSSEQSRQLLATVKLNNVRRGIMRQLDLLIIDEISMVRCDVLDALDVVLRSVRHRNDLPFGGVQVLMIGDMYQLPPVARDEEWNILKEHYDSPYFFDSRVVKEVRPVYIELEKIYRQDEPVFIDLLNKVRNNLIDEAAIDLLNSRYKSIAEMQADTIMLTTHNYMADQINQRELDRLQTKEITYTAAIEGIFPEKSYPAEMQLKLKVGARVMFIRNDINKRYFNGKTGTIKELTDENISVSCEGEDFDIWVGQEVWENVQYKLNRETNKIEDDIAGTFRQFPLRLAWAITIHKSQGLTFEKVAIDAAQAFTSGQVYVALSRCRTLNGIVLRSLINKNSLTNDSKILSFANTKTPEEHVSNYLTDGRKSYVQQIILSLFSIKSLLGDLNLIDRKFQELRSQFVNADLNWLRNLSDALMALEKVEQKFIQELNPLFQGSAQEFVEKRNERIKKAAVYFIERLEQLKVLLMQCPWITESMLASKEINPLLDVFYESLVFKMYLLDSCKQNFDLQEYTKHRHLYRKSEYRFNIYATKQKYGSNADTPHPKLYEALQQLRDEICEKENKPIYMVANRSTLLDLVKFLPTDQKSLLSIRGFGVSKAEMFGKKFITLIKDYMEENNLESPIAPEIIIKEKSSKPKAAKGSTMQTSFDMFKKGASPTEIAVARNLTLSTISTHLIPFIEIGELKIERLLSDAKMKEIKKVLTDFPEETKLTELKSHCSEDITFDDLRFFIAGRKKVDA